MSFADRVGVSTDSLFDVSLDRAVRLLSDAGFTAFEIVPADFQAAGGFPYSRLNPGVWPRTCSSEQRAALRERLSCFSRLSVHAPHLGVDIASRNPGIRGESVRQYMECIEFAHDIGARIVSFHHSGVHGSVAFAREALRLAHEWDLNLAFENGLTVSPIEQILDQVADDRLGLLLDVGHAANGRLNVEEIIRRFAGRIVELHASGVYRGDEFFPQDGWGIDHFPLELNDAVDYPRVLSALHATTFDGPVILEICYARDGNAIVEYCKCAKDFLVSLHGTVEE